MHSLDSTGAFRHEDVRGTYHIPLKPGEKAKYKQSQVLDGATCQIAAKNHNNAIAHAYRMGGANNETETRSADSAETQGRSGYKMASSKV